MCSVRQSRHSSDPRWFRRIYGSCRVTLRTKGKEERARWAHFGEVDGLEGEFAESLASVDVGL